MTSKNRKWKNWWSSISKVKKKTQLLSSYQALPWWAVSRVLPCLLWMLHPLFEHKKKDWRKSDKRECYKMNEKGLINFQITMAVQNESRSFFGKSFLIKVWQILKWLCLYFSLTAHQLEMGGWIAKLSHHFTISVHEPLLWPETAASWLFHLILLIELTLFALLLYSDPVCIPLGNVYLVSLHVCECIESCLVDFLQ